MRWKQWFVLAVLGAGGLAAAAPAGAQLAFITNRGDDTISVIDTATDTVVDTIAGGGLFGPEGIEVSHDGTKLYIGNNGVNGTGNTVSVIDVATRQEVALIDLGENSGPEGMALHPDGKTLWVSTGRVHVLPPDCIADTVVVIDTTTNAVQTVIDVGDHPWDVDIAPDGRKAYVFNAHDETISVVDTATFAITKTIMSGDGGCDFCKDWHQVPGLFSPDGSRLWITIMHDDQLQVLDTVTDEIIATLDVRDPECGERPTCKITKCEHPMGLAFTRDGSEVIWSHYFGDEISWVDPDTFLEVDRIATERGAHPKVLAMHPDGEKLYAVQHEADSVLVIDSASRTVLKEIPVGVLPISFDGDFIQPPSWVGGYFIGVAPSDVTCKNLTTGQTVSFAPDGRYFNCQKHGLTVSVGQRVQVAMGGFSDGVMEVSGRVYGMSTQNVICQNRTTGQTFRSGLLGATWWNCQDKGLNVDTGNNIRMTIGGSAKAPPPMAPFPPREVAKLDLPPGPDGVRVTCPYLDNQGVGGCDFCSSPRK